MAAVVASGPEPLDNCELVRGRVESIEPVDDAVLVMLVKDGECHCCRQPIQWRRARYLPESLAPKIRVGMQVELFRSGDDILMRELAKGAKIPPFLPPGPSEDTQRPSYEALGLSLRNITLDLREIVGLLSKGPKGPRDIAMICNLGDGAVQDRIRRLKEAGIVERETISRTMNGRTFTAPTKRYKLTPAYLTGAVQL